MTKLTQGTWVLIADGHKALFTVNQTDGEDPFLSVLKKEEQDNPPTREQGTGPAGRFGDGSSAQRSAVEETDWHELEKERFAEELADMLYKRAHRGDFERLVLVAAPQTLGQLRGALHSEVSSKVVGEIGKNLTNHPMNEIEQIVKTELAD